MGEGNKGGEVEVGGGRKRERGKRWGMVVCVGKRGSGMGRGEKGRVCVCVCVMERKRKGKGRIG